MTLAQAFALLAAQGARAVLITRIGGVLKAVAR